MLRQDLTKVKEIKACLEGRELRSFFPDTEFIDHRGRVLRRFRANGDVLENV